MLPLGFGVAHVAQRGVRPRALAVAVLPVFLMLVIHVGYQNWLASSGRTPLIVSPITSVTSTEISRFAQISVSVLFNMLPYVGLFLAPFVSFFLPIGKEIRSGSCSKVYLVGTGLLALCLLFLFATCGTMLPDLGNVLLPFGIGPLTLADTFLANRNLPSVSSLLRLLWPLATLWSSLVVALIIVRVGTMLLHEAVGAWRRSSLHGTEVPVLLTTVIVLYLAGVFVISYQSNWFDRYLIVIIPPILGLLVWRRGNSEIRWPLITIIALVLYGLFSVAATHDYLAWNRARWHALNDLMNSGVAPRQIDGGYEFNGWNLNDPKYQRVPGKSYWWVIDDAYMVASGPVRGYRAIAKYKYRRWLDGGQVSEVAALKRLE